MRLSNLKPLGVWLFMPILALMYLLFWLNSLAAGLAVNHYVTPDGNCNGVSPCYSTIQAAVDAAAEGDTIKVAEGRYTASGLQVVLLDKGVILAGGYAKANWNSANPDNHPTIVDAENVLGRRPFYISNNDTFTATVRGFVIENGYQDGFATNGAGIYV